ncbi:NirD/YgiW/YdeI family stress tolerance protein [uncultured Algimonas sp.]|uniref:NirD/YgiW/YdeI family stress tolerance protein n=1 Tax=uncultured Algimonas sp. TaxID=1547920 RepID=UPI002618D7BF|nr:NirD/YgiW/YdeI family stress tolerance protein [uncultured Algimonas sp.]
MTIRLAIPVLFIAAFALPACAQTASVSEPHSVVKTPSGETVTPIRSVQRGTSVVLQGTVDRILDEDEFRLRDDSGHIKVYVGPNLVPAQTGDRVTVRGLVDDDNRREVYAREMVLSDGSTVVFDRRYE